MKLPSLPNPGTAKQVLGYIKDKLALFNSLQATPTDLTNLALSLRNASDWTRHQDPAMLEKVREYFPHSTVSTIYQSNHTNKFLVVTHNRVLPAIFQYTPTGGRVSIVKLIQNNEANWLVTIYNQIAKHAKDIRYQEQLEDHQATQSLFNDPFVNRSGAGFNTSTLPKRSSKAFFEVDN